jgi:hypothetical protein
VRRPPIEKEGPLMCACQYHYNVSALCTCSCDSHGWRRKTQVEAEWVVGQQVSGDDYDRLPVGSVVGLGLGFASWTKAPDGLWRDASEVVAADGEIKRFGRTLTHLPEHAEPEDATDASVEPEPLRKGDHVLVWVTVDGRADSDEDVRLKPAFFGEVDPSMEHFYSRTDAIVRPDAGQVPPWVKPVEEPMGLGAVVDAEHAGEDVRFVRVGGDDTRHPWYAWLDERSYYSDWTALKDPKVRSQGYIAGGAS